MSDPNTMCPIPGCGRILGRGGLTLHMLHKHPDEHMRRLRPAQEPKAPQRRTWPIGMSLTTVAIR